MTITVEESVTGMIAVALVGDGLNYIAIPTELIAFLNDEQADKLAFQLGAVLQDRERKKSLTK